VLDGRTGPAAARLQPLLVHVGPDGRTRPTKLLHVDRGRLAPDDVVEHRGLMVVRPGAACLSIARRYGVEEGLVAADATVAAGLTTFEELAELSSRVPRRARGVRASREVAQLVDGRSASPPESRLRYVWLVLARLPKPLVNVTVIDQRGGVLGKPDLLDPEAAAAVEYDGGQHRDLDHHSADNEREERLERVNLVVARATALDLWPRRAHLVDRLRDAHRRGETRDRSRDRWDWRLT
jgi:hypothetical protein